MPFSVKKWTEDEDKNERCLDTLLLKKSKSQEGRNTAKGRLFQFTGMRDE